MHGFCDFHIHKYIYDEAPEPLMCGFFFSTSQYSLYHVVQHNQYFPFMKTLKARCCTCLRWEFCSR